MKQLTPRQQAFVEAYVTGLSARDAATKAGYSANAAHSQATRLLKNAYVKEAIAEFQQEKRGIAVMEYHEACRLLSAQARGNVADYFGEDGAIDMDRLRNHCPEAVAGVKQRTEIDDDGNATVVTEFKLHDRTRTIDRLAKLRGWDQPAKVAPTNPEGTEEYRPPALSPDEVVQTYMEAINRAVSDD